MAVAALTALGGTALAGPNAGGTLNVHDANFVYTTDITTYCGRGVVPSSCQDIDANLEGSDAGNPKVWKVYAAFPDNSAPRLKGMTFGVTYSESELILTAWGPCIGDPNNGAAEFPGAGWPAPNTGTSIVWQNTQTSQLVEAYWFAGYNYYGNQSQFCVTQHPDPILGGNFGDDSVPTVQDPIAGFGCMGIDSDGTVACPGTGQPTGACCVGDVCTITTEADCQGSWQGPDTGCDPNPCFVTPTGACCVGESCTVTTEADCQGTYQGDNTGCDPNPCLAPPTGACCVDQECTITTEADCQGRYQGDNTTCDPNPCQGVPTEETSWGQIKHNYR
jgi:hypothetical protein